MNELARGLGLLDQALIVTCQVTGRESSTQLQLVGVASSCVWGWNLARFSLPCSSSMALALGLLLVSIRGNSFDNCVLCVLLIRHVFTADG